MDDETILEINNLVNQKFSSHNMSKHSVFIFICSVILTILFFRYIRPDIIYSHDKYGNVVCNYQLLILYCLFVGICLVFLSRII